MNENKEELKNWFEQKFIQPEAPQDTHLSIDDFLLTDTLQENSITASTHFRKYQKKLRERHVKFKTVFCAIIFVLNCASH